jgi:MYXO-CTERM domain-containing protein
MNKLGLMACTLAPLALLGCSTQPESTAFRVEQLEVAGNQTPYFVRGALGQVTETIHSAAQAQQAIAGVLPDIAETLGVPAQDLVASRVDRDDLGMSHIRMTQQKNGLRVVNGDVIVSVDAEGTVRTVHSSARDRELPSKADVSAADAARVALDGLLDSDAAKSELTYLVSNNDGELYLTWEVAVRQRGNGLTSELVYVDAQTGKVVDRHPQLFSLKNRVVTNGNGGVFPVANAPVIGNETTLPVDPVALAAFNNVGTTYDCYKALYNRDSYDNLGATLTSQMHVVFATGNGQTTPNNAVWAAQQRMMAYGDGDGNLMKQLAYALDVTSHELTHAVTSSTANLVYQNESGALNEALSDIMGAVCEAWKAKAVSPNTWLVGEDIWTPNTAGDALRYMHSPTLDTQSPDYYPERYTGTADNGGVHLNSGLPNLTFYLLAAGGKHPRNKTTINVPSIGIDKAGAIFQRALTTKFGPNTNMAQARTLTEQAALELYPASCAATAVGLAWAAVGVGGPAPTDVTAPTVAITSPASGAKVSAGFTVEVNTTDDKCINKVELLIDGVVAQTLTAPPYTFTTAATLANGAHTLEVRSYDALNQATASANVTVGGGGNGGGDGDGDADSELTGGCNVGGQAGGGFLLLGLAALLRLRRRR